MTTDLVRRLALDCGFDLAGVTRAEPVVESGIFLDWVRSGKAGAMQYLTGRRADLRRDPRLLLPSARSVVCVGKLYNGPEPRSTEFRPSDLAWISRYAWGDDYHEVLRRELKRLAGMMAEQAGFGFEWKTCVDTAPFLDVAYAAHAGLGWIGKHTCLINQQRGSWFFLGALLTSLDLAPDSPAPDRCGTCTRCIEACPTDAIVRFGKGWTVDARRCISYLTIELRGAIPVEQRGGIGNHVFGCDICQDVCPWNRRAPADRDPEFAPRVFAPPLERLAALTEEEFGDLFRGSAIARCKYQGFLRNVAVAMGNSSERRFRQPLERLAARADPVIREHARWALEQLGA